MHVTLAPFTTPARAGRSHLGASRTEATVAAHLFSRRRVREMLSTCCAPYRAEALEPRMLLAVTITATLQDTLLTDVDADTRFDPGDTIQYTAVISNTGDT